MNFILIITAVVLISSANGAPGSDHKKHGGPMKCDGTELKMTEDMQQGMKACYAKYHSGLGARNHTENSETKTTDDKSKDHKMHHHPNMTCTMMCKLQAFGVISQDGKADKAKTETFVKEVFPASVQDALIASYGTCVDEKGASMAVTADGKCDSYKPFVKCIMEANAKACKWGDKDDEQ